MANEKVLTHFLVTPDYLELRRASLDMPAKQFGKMVKTNNTVYGMVIDIPMNPKQLMTMVVYINGAVNLYFNNGGSYTRAAERYQTLVRAGQLLVANAGRILAESKKTTSFVLPTGKTNHIYLLTKNGIYNKNILPAELAQESQDARVIYSLYQQVMREIHSCQLKDNAAKNQ